MRFVWVGVGGAVGSLLRYAVALLTGDSDFPWGTLIVNIVGSFALGMLLAYALGRWPATVVTGLSVGLIGGFTTFSTFAWETVSMAGSGSGRAIFYLAISLVGGLSAAWLGSQVIRVGV